MMGAQSVTSSLLVRLPAAPIRTAVAEQPAAAMAMIQAMSSELADLTRQLVDLKVRVAAQRLGTYLLSFVDDPTATKVDFRLPISKGLLAPWLGCRAENLSRAFTALRAFGVETHGSRVTLHDVSRLRAYAGVRERGRRPVSVEKVFGDAFMLRRGTAPKN
jgi:CRP-like cAMP-binding protein